MGLDIHVDTHIGDRIDETKISHADAENYYDIPDITRLYVDYSPLDQHDDLESGFYRCGDKYERSFKAGSYSGYNRWREKLSLLALGVMPEEVWDQPELYRGKPFVELIHFSDCEGVIGPKTSAKLAKDFVEFKERAEEDEGLKEYSSFMPYSHYDEWAEAFKLAAETHGVVVLA